MQQPYQLIVFDWDGTLMDSIGRIVSSMQATARQLALPVPATDAVKGIIGLSLAPAIERLFGQLAAPTYAKFLDVYRDQYVTLDTTPTPLFDGVPELLDDLRGQGYLLAVATGKARRGLDRVMTESQLHEVFVATRCADESASKPNPQMLHEIMQATGVTPQQTLMIGDSDHDLAMARAANVDALAVSFGALELTSHSHYQQHPVLHSWHDFPQFLAQRTTERCVVPS
ncbi:HAD family hydrolase [Pseudidiomarina sediminum]|uniref:HAD family hydrolase n=1 Tax=Pseudidiomarina sediminum TaxID=431675 RepID=A0A432Z7Z1_9GAMM|nr:HAD-IA family hydrolase [Pseudidiomarina sediminum]RUO73992.1 HAD family hydrolase [Pseudidiomarina sediminum]